MQVHSQVSNLLGSLILFHSYLEDSYGLPGPGGMCDCCIDGKGALVEIGDPAIERAEGCQLVIKSHRINLCT